MPEAGTVVDCPNCLGGKREDFMRKKCPVCKGEKRVEKQRPDGVVGAPAGSWMPANKRGPSGYCAIVVGPAKWEMIR